MIVRKLGFLLVILLAGNCVILRPVFAGAGKKSLANSGIISPSGDASGGYSKKGGINKNLVFGKQALQFGKGNPFMSIANPVANMSKTAKPPIQKSVFSAIPKIGALSMISDKAKLTAAGSGIISAMPNKMKSFRSLNMQSGIAGFGGHGRSKLRTVATGIDKRLRDSEDGGDIFQAFRK